VRRVLLAVGSLIVTSCATFGGGSGLRAVGRATFQEGGEDVTHERRRYSVELYEDGTLAFDGTECVVALGRQYKTLPNDRFRRVARLFADECPGIVIPEAGCDHGDAIRIACGNVEKFERTACERVAPARSAEEFLGKLVEAADLQEWVGPREHTCKAR
jgi:hypothetical protein